MRGDQLSRQWRLFQRLARSRFGIGLEDLASDLACTKRTVYRDLDALMYAGFPITSEKRDGRVFYQVVAGFRLDDFRRMCLMQGLDRIGLTLRHEADIDAYERKRWPALARR